MELAAGPVPPAGEVNMKYPADNDNEEIPAGMDIPDPRLASISLSLSLTVSSPVFGKINKAGAHSTGSEETLQVFLYVFCPLIVLTVRPQASHTTQISEQNNPIISQSFYL